MTSKDPWRTATPSDSIYTFSSGSTEVDLRQEIINLLDGKYPEISKKQTGALRRMRRDSNSNTVLCECVDTLTKEGDKDRWCPLCFGEGKKFDEELVTFYKVLIGASGNNAGASGNNALLDQYFGAGLLNTPLVVFYLRYSTALTKEDKVVTLSLNSEGNVNTPYVRTGVYRIGTVWEYRADNGRIEYYKLFTFKEDFKYLNAPSYADLD